VERHVRLPRRREVVALVGRLGLAKALVHDGDVGIGRPGDREPDGRLLDGAPQDIDLVEVVLGQAGDEGSASRQVPGQALPGQLVEGVPDGSAGHPEPLGKVRLEEPRTRGEAPFEDLVPELVRDRFPELLVCERGHRRLPWTLRSCHPCKA
jgi:hypothetical protein